MACFVRHESPRTHPVLQLQIVAVLPGTNKMQFNTFNFKNRVDDNSKNKKIAQNVFPKSVRPEKWGTASS